MTMCRSLHVFGHSTDDLKPKTAELLLLVWVAFLSVSTAVTTVPIPQHGAVIINGKLDDPVWQDIAPTTLVPTQPGVTDPGGEVRAAIAGRYLYLGARLPEPTGRITARSVGRNPVWEGGEAAPSETSPRRYYQGADDGEDFLRVILRVPKENDWMVQIGPLGAYSVKWRWTGESAWYISSPEKCDRFEVATAVGEKEWRVELAIPLDQLGSPTPASIRLAIERNRAERPGHPGERWRWPEHEPTAPVAVLPADGESLPEPVVRAPMLGNSNVPIEVGRVSSLPPLESEWTDEFWRDVPVWRLYRNQSPTMPARFPTEVKLLHDGHSLAVMARCIEPGQAEPDDSFNIYLATSGSAYVEYTINPSGFISDAVGHSGGPRVSRPYEWNSPVRGTARQERGEWIARLDLPLDSIAKVLDETQLPQKWRVLFLRSRPARGGEPQETSVLPITQSVTPICPARYRLMEMVSKPTSQANVGVTGGPNGDLAFVPARVLSPDQRQQMNLAGMVEHNIRERVLEILENERHDWDGVKTVADWERFRDSRLKALTRSLGALRPARPLSSRMTKEFRGDGYRRQDVAFESRPGSWITANLYLPTESHGPMPAIVIVHSHHGSKTQFELQDMGILWARSGCAVLIMDQLGYGERMENYPWDREAHNSRSIIGTQLCLAGENLMSWVVWDIMRGIDFLFERRDINQSQIMLLGAVAGGGDPAAVAAAVDPRVAAVVPFNFGEAEPEEARFEPEKNQWPLELADPGWGDMESTGALPRSIVDQCFPWLICASVAPRRLVYAFELGWKVEELPAWSRYKKVFGFYNAEDHLADAHGFGPFPGPGECWNIGPAQRKSLYPTLERWFGIPIPFADAQSSRHENLAKRAIVDRRPESELAVLTPKIASELGMQSVHRLAQGAGETKLNSARSELAKLTSEEKKKSLRIRLASKLGDIEPNRAPDAVLHWTKQVPGAAVEGITVAVEPGIVVPLLLFRPTARPGARTPVVVAVSEGGKEGFLSERSGEIQIVLRNGIALCLPDVRGTGETSPDPKLDPDGDEIREHLSGMEVMMGNTLLGKRMKDLRTVLAYLRTRKELDPDRIGLWGDSFTPVNPARVLLDELPQWRVGPEIQYEAEPLGGLLAIMGALYEPNVRAVTIRRGLVSYMSMLEDQFTYVPSDVAVPGILEVGDIADLASAMAPRPLLLEGLVDGRDRAVSAAVLRRQLEPIFESYRATSPANLTVDENATESGVAEWFRAHL